MEQKLRGNFYWHVYVIPHFDSMLNVLKYHSYISFVEMVEAYGWAKYADWNVEIRES